MNWFHQLTGFEELSPDQVRDHIHVDGATMISRVNGRTMSCGRLETPTLGELRQRIRATDFRTGGLKVASHVGDVRQMHVDPANAGAMFQVASQFNLLEMVSENVTPERGVTGYEWDRTQGPACAIAAGAGTIYRNYFVDLGQQVGQSEFQQIDCSEDLGMALGNHDQRLWSVKNGYLLLSHDGIQDINRTLSELNDPQRDALREKLRIGLHWNVEVTWEGASHVVSQAYCSALPVAYSQHSCEDSEPLARLILEAAYESTCLAALLGTRVGPSRHLYLTLLGGGAFGNEFGWIGDAIRRALKQVESLGAELDVTMVTYGGANPIVESIVAEFAPSGESSQADGRLVLKCRRASEPSHSIREAGRTLSPLRDEAENRWES